MSQSTREIEREVEQNRAEIDQTARELRSRLSVSQLIDEAGRMMGASDFVSNLGRRVRDNPLPVLLIGIGVAWFMISGSRAPYGRERELLPDEEAFARIGDIPTDETERLIASDKVEGTNVYNRQGVHLGHVHNFMIDKYAGEVAYAVMSFGGFLGIGERYHPLPWRALDYDIEMGGFVVDLDRSRLEGAPHYGPDEDPWSRDRNYGRSVYDYYDYFYE